MIEVLIIILIVGLLAAMLIPALQAAREAGRRAHCSNDLRQLGVALHSYHDAQGSLPPAVIWAPIGEPLGAGRLPIGVLDRVAMFGDPKQDRIYANWAIFLLSHLEEAPLLQQFDLRMPIGHPSNSARASDLAVMMCPSDAFNGTHFFRGIAHGLNGNEFARGNYAINVGADAACIMGIAGPGEACANGFFVSGLPLESHNNKVWGSGMAGVNRAFRFSEARDGLSHTVVLDEIRAGVDAMDPRGVWALGQVGSSVLARHGEAGYTAGPNPDSADADEVIGCQALVAKIGKYQLQLLGMGCDDALESNTRAAARSMHPGGVHVVFCDGSAHFVVDLIDSATWIGMHTRSGAEPSDGH